MTEGTRAEVQHSKQIGLLKGHNGWVSRICVCPNDPNTLITASRDKSINIWRMYVGDGELRGKLMRTLVGHNHFVSDCSLSQDGGHLISCSWDRTLRLWDIRNGICRRTFVGHTNDVMGVAFSYDNRQIVSCARDRTIRLWNTLAVQKFMFEEDGHSGCVSAVTTLPVDKHIGIISSGWDGVVKSWKLSPPSCTKTFYGHSSPVNTISVSPDYSLLASGAKNGSIRVWELEKNICDCEFETKQNVAAVAFNPQLNILAAGADSEVYLYNVSERQLYQKFAPVDLSDVKRLPRVVSICWSLDGKCLFVGYTDNVIRVFNTQPGE